MDISPNGTDPVFSNVHPVITFPLPIVTGMLLNFIPEISQLSVRSRGPPNGIPVIVIFLSPPIIFDPIGSVPNSPNGSSEADIIDIVIEEANVIVTASSINCASSVAAVIVQFPLAS